MMRYVLALDFGASSGRAMLAGFDGSRITLQEVHRFANEPVSKDGRLYWNVPQLMEELEQGLQAGYAIAPYESIAIDTWGVDYGMLGADGTLLELPRHYRDGRTDGILKKAEQFLPAAELYRRTGTQVMEINTLFQLLCQRDSRDGCGFQNAVRLIVADAVSPCAAGQLPQGALLAQDL